MKKIREKKPELSLVLACYLAGLVLLLAWHAILFASNRLARQAGAIRPAELGIQDFDLEGMVEQDGRLITLDADPQMRLRDVERRVDSLTLELEYQKPPLVVNVFYAKLGQGHNEWQKVYSFGRSDTFLLPARGGQQLRIDPGMVAGNQIEVRRIAINQPRNWYTFFIPSTSELALFLVLPGLVASGIWTVHQFLDMRRARKAVRPL